MGRGRGVRAARSRGGVGVVRVLDGAFTETDWMWRDGILARGASRRWRAGESIPVVAGGIHSMVAHDAGTTLHIYHPAISGMRRVRSGPPPDAVSCAMTAAPGCRATKH